MNRIIIILISFLFIINGLWTAENQAENQEQENPATENQNPTEERTENPIHNLREWVNHVKNKNWSKVINFFGYRFNDFLKQVYQLYKDNPDEMKKFLVRQGIPEPQKTGFPSVADMAVYLFQESKIYKTFFEDVQKKFIKITIDYYHKAAGTIYEKIDSRFYDTLNYSLVRKLKIYLSSDRIFFIRRDIKGWYIDITAM